MGLWIADDPRLATVPAHDLSLGDRLDGVVGALAMNVRLDELQQVGHGSVGKEDHVVDHAERGHELRTVRRRQNRPPNTLQRRDGLVIVHSDDQPIRLGGRCREVADMADVQQVEATVRERNGLPGCAIGTDQLQKLFAGDDRSHVSRG